MRWGLVLGWGVAVIVSDFFGWATRCFDQTECTGTGLVAFYAFPVLVIAWVALAVSAFVARRRRHRG